MAQNPGQQRRHDVLVAALARGVSHSAAAQQSGFSRRTVQRRLDDSTFRDEVRRTRDGLMSEAAGRVAGLMESACDALRDLLASGDEDVRLSAAKATFDFALKLRTNADLESRLQTLEDRINVQT